mmetsp:Transcript_6767/g.18276  ORF Transcript_6767/g.18276 Transcript_6767/m.18276 type:complete len:378 (-) Transcript_6767:241-1374(-)
MAEACRYVRAAGSKQHLRWPPSDLDVRGGRPHVHVDPLHHGLQLPHGPHLEELVHAVLDHRAHGGLPQHRRAQLLRQQWHEVRRRRAGLDLLASDVHVDVTGWRLHLGHQLLQGHRQLLLRWLHQVGVKATRGLEQLGLHCPCLLYLLFQPVDGVGRACAREAPREEQVRNLADLVADRLLFAELLQGLLVDAEDGEHGLRSAVRSLGHGLSAELHQLHALLEGEDASCAESCVFTQRQACHCPWPLNGLRPHLAELDETGHASQEHARLADASLLQLALWAVEAVLQGVPAQDCLRRADHLLDLRCILEGRQHVDILRALSGKEERDSRWWWAGWLRGLSRLLGGHHHRGDRGLLRHEVLRVLLRCLDLGRSHLAF